MRRERQKELRNKFRCPFCGAGVMTIEGSRNCYKCGTPMDFEGKENKR